MMSTQKLQIIFLAVILTALPQIATAQQVCKKDGYTISTVNGVFTDEEGARYNERILKLILKEEYKGEKLDYQYLLNPTHLGGVGDILKSVEQGVFDHETISDYDLVEMLNDASQKVKTQKLLLVAHSQGNFYANSFYDTVADKVGGVPARSIGVYSVATPASRVAGGGEWLTSDTDKVVATFVGHVPFKKIMPPDTHIVLGPDDEFIGHDFAKVYLKYQGPKIVADIQSSLSRLSSDPERREDIACIDPPQLTIAHKVEGAVFAVLDPVAKTAIDVVVQTGATGGVFVKKIIHIARDAADTFYKFAGSMIHDKGLGESNGAAIILATTEGPQSEPAPAEPKSNLKSKPKTPVTAPGEVSAASAHLAPPLASTPPRTHTPAVSKPAGADENPVIAKPPIKLIFIGGSSLGGGGGSSPAAEPRVLGTTDKTTEAPSEKTPDVAPEPPLASQELGTPVPTIAQCAYSLATDSCLLATTTLHVGWSEIPGAAYYATDKNGVYATTTNLAEDVIAHDFSDYTFEVAAVGLDGQTSATSTKTVSVASIPVAINEVAWMGTQASSTAEWLELKNNTAQTIDLGSWVLSAEDSKPFINLAGTIAPHAFYLLERKGDGTIADRTADLVYGNNSASWALNNNGETLILSHKGTTLDTTATLARGAWPAGENSTTTRKTMERYASKEPGSDPANWGTNLGFIKNGIDAAGNAIEGTPGERNSVSYLINKGQDITSDLTLAADEGPYVAPRDILVAASSTLTIEPGVEISFSGNPRSGSGHLVVEGKLDARGTAENPITFNSFQPPQIYGPQIGGVGFRNGTGTSTLDHVSLENIGATGAFHAAIEIHNSSFTNTYGGIDAYEGSTVLVENTSFTSSTSGTIVAYGGSTINIASSTITNQFYGDAVGAYDGSTLVVASTTIDGVHRGDGIGVYDSTLTVASSTIKNISGDGIGLYDATSTISNAVIANGKEDGIGVYGGAATIASTTVTGFINGSGVTIAASPEPVVITGGEITGNAVGVDLGAGSAVLDNVSIHDNTQDLVAPAAVE